MDQQEIEDVKLTVAEDAKEKIDPLEDDAIYALSETEGWRIMMKKANKLIVSLLEPIDAGDLTADANMALIGANTLANAKALKVLREFVNQVESVKNAKRLMIKTQQGEVKTEA